ncbi:hypothetical protein Pcinc_042776 [Petrolisthes cinctipes]|uniref:Uncharacterized protein n=1 Tax=Petrolisthes cinctipes TaxID=88211 RepID=A0AAE1EIH3_PETCI|nr:hypothetical protein Pcinc_042776 [Petrolisthes cinctipes]
MMGDTDWSGLGWGNEGVPRGVKGEKSCITNPLLHDLYFPTATTIPPQPHSPNPLTPNPLTPNPLTPNPLTPNPLTPNPLTPNPLTPNPLTPNPLAPNPLTPNPLTPNPLTHLLHNPTLSRNHKPFSNSSVLNRSSRIDEASVKSFHYSNREKPAP